MTESLAEALPKEQERVREIVAIYDTIPAGALASAMMRQSLSRAERAVASGDVGQMMASLQELREYEL